MLYCILWCIFNMILEHYCIILLPKVDYVRITSFLRGKFYKVSRTESDYLAADGNIAFCCWFRGSFFVQYSVDYSALLAERNLKHILVHG